MSDLPNTPEFTVSELAGAVKKTLEGAFGRVRVRGEITELKAYGSGHQYFALKDEGAKIRAIIWKMTAPRVGLKPENGVEVIATGRITSYSERSEYQLIVERLEYAGAGAMLARIEALKAKLAAEGLFDPARRRALPVLPRLIGVVTSAQGAVLQDIKTTIARRFPTAILLWPVPVQGEAAAAAICAAISGFCRLPVPGIARPDVLIVARGGGSLEDLMAFSDETVVRAAAACTIPLISAVGHETDTTLIDFVADRRAPTPTAAAEMAIPARLELLADLAQKSARLTGGFARVVNQDAARLAAAGARLPDLPAILGAARQRLDDRGERLALALPNFAAAKHRRLDAAVNRLLHPREILLRRGYEVEQLQQRMRSLPPARLRELRSRVNERGERLVLALPNFAASKHRRLDEVANRLARPRLREARLRLDGLAARLDVVSYEAVLKRGFALVLNRAGQAVKSAGAVTPGAALTLKFCDGDVAVQAAGKQGVLPF